MSVGITVQKSDVDNIVGAIGRDLNSVIGRVVQFKAWLDAQGDPDLTALGFGAGDIATLRSAVADAKQLADIFAGAAPLTDAKDFRTFLKRVWGLGL